MTNSDPAASAARAAAQRLTTEYGPGLTADVEVALYARNATAPRASQYIDPVSLGSLIVSIATLAWTVYTDLRHKTTEPSPEVIARKARIRLREHCGTAMPDENYITEVVITEIIQAAEDQS
jgi:hypothetical protein